MPIHNVVFVGGPWHGKTMRLDPDVTKDLVVPCDRGFAPVGPLFDATSVRPFRTVRYHIAIMREQHFESHGHVLVQYAVACVGYNRPKIDTHLWELLMRKGATVEAVPTHPELWNLA